MHPYFQEKKKTCRIEAAIKGCGGLEGGLPFFVSKSWDINVAYFKPFYIVRSNRMHLYFQELEVKPQKALPEGGLHTC